MTTTKSEPVTVVQTGYAAEPHVHKQPEERHLDAPLLQLDLARELSELRGSEVYRAHRYGAKTLARYPDLRVVLIAFEAGARMERHQAKSRVSVQVLEGHVALALSEQSVELRAGGVLVIAPDVPHDVEAREQSAILVTLAWAGAPQAGG